MIRLWHGCGRSRVSITVDPVEHCNSMHLDGFDGVV